MDNVRKKVIGYTRVSSLKQVEGASLDVQHDKIMDYCDSHDFEVVRWFSDPGFTAKTANRPGLNDLMAYCAAHRGEIDHVVVYNVSRISRNLQSYASCIGNRLATMGVTLRSTAENIDDTPEGHLMLNFALVVHQYDNECKGQTTHDNMAAVYRQGWWLTNCPLGYVIEKVLIGERDHSGKQKTHSKLVRDDRNDLADKIGTILNRFSEGDISQAELLRLAQKMDIRTKKGGLISETTLVRVLKSPIYAGYYHSNKLCSERDELIRMKVDPLITLEVYRRNQVLLNSDKKVFASNPSELYPLKGTLICAKCGGRLRGSSPRTGSGGHYPRYNCGCKGHGSLSAKIAHSLFNEFLQNVAPSDEILKLFKEITKRTAAKKLGEVNRELGELDRLREGVSDKINQILESVVDGLITVEEKDVMIEQQKKKRSKIEAEIERLKGTQRVSEATIEYVCNFMKKPAKLWRDADLEARRAFQHIMFPKGLHFNLKEKKFRTEDLSPLFSVIYNKNGSSDDPNPHMEPLAGIEPVTCSLRMSCSTN